MFLIPLCRSSSSCKLDIGQQGEIWMYIAVDVNATFNTVGDIKPMYIRLEDNNHILHVYKILEVISKEVNRNGLHNYFTFTCTIQCNDEIKTIKIKYYPSSNKWLLIN